MNNQIHLIKTSFLWLVLCFAAALQAEPVATATHSAGLWDRISESGFVVSMVLIVLVVASLVCWAILFAKYFFLRKLSMDTEQFIDKFWDSHSLNDLNTSLKDFDESPAKEMFRSGYSELVRGSRLRQSSSNEELATKAVMGNMGRTLRKARMAERRAMERYLPILAICASAAPFIGLFGTVWGIMTAFQGIAETGSASLAAVAPGISEALIATAFGLAAAIPAAIGFNVFSTMIRRLMTNLDNFGADFLNIVEGYLVSETGDIE